MLELLIEQTEAAVWRSLQTAEKYYGARFDLADIRFDLRGRAAGQVRFPLRQALLTPQLPIMRFNPELLAQHSRAFIHEVVPHECAHVVVYHRYARLFSSKTKRPKPHGAEWQSVMRDVFQLEPRVTHNFSLPPSQRPRFEYLCACEKKVHQISLIRHNKIARGKTAYLCKVCGDALVPQQVASVGAQ